MKVLASKEITDVGLSSKVQWYIMQVSASLWLREDSGIQLTISPLLLSPILSPVGNPRGGLMKSALFILFFKETCSYRPVAFPESHFQCVTVFLHLILNLVVWIAQPKTFDCSYNYRKQYVPLMSCVPYLLWSELKVILILTEFSQQFNWLLVDHQ